MEDIYFEAKYHAHKTTIPLHIVSLRTMRSPQNYISTPYCVTLIKWLRNLYTAAVNSFTWVQHNVNIIQVFRGNIRCNRFVTLAGVTRVKV